jgi:hypothetical protein
MGLHGLYLFTFLTRTIDDDEENNEGYVARMGEKKNECRILGGKP